MKDNVRSLEEQTPKIPSVHIGIDQETGDYTLMHPKKKNMYDRSVDSVSMNFDGDVFITVNRIRFHGREQTEFRENEVKNWDEIVTPKVLAKLKKPRRKRSLKEYKFSNSYSVVKTGSRYVSGCQSASRAHMIAFCKAILQDEGEL